MWPQFIKGLFKIRCVIGIISAKQHKQGVLHKKQLTEQVHLWTLKHFHLRGCIQDRPSQSNPLLLRLRLKLTMQV